MNQEIPKPLRNALARQAVGDVHPSPDVLTSFVERTLAPVESEVVVHHLAQCAECREIVFLASAAAENEVLDEKELVAAAATSHVAAMPARVVARGSAATKVDKSQRRLTSRMRWAISIAAAALVVAGGIVLRFSRASSGHNAAPITVASNRAVPAIPETTTPALTAPNSQQAAKPSVPETQAKAAPHGTTAAHAPKVPAPSTVARNAPAESTLASKATPAAAPAGAPSTPAVIGGAASFAIPAAPTQNSFAESESSQTVQQTAPLAFGKTRTGILSVYAVRPQWRIGPEGHLERSVAVGQWTRALDDQPTKFHAVAVTGSNVWAGGNGGTLFHSSDGGEHWNKVALAVNSKVETGAIVSIHFDDSQHGVVTSDTGTRWATTDGGLTWLTP